MVGHLSLHGLSPFEIRIRKTELINDLSGLKMAILAIANLLAEGFLNYVSISVQDIVSILVKLITGLFSYSVGR